MPEAKWNGQGNPPSREAAMDHQPDSEHPAARRIRDREAREAGIDVESQSPEEQARRTPDVGAFRRLRERANAASRLERENEELRLEIAFKDSGLTLTDQQRSALLAVHEGEIDGEALRATAEGLAFVDPPQVPAEEQAAHQRVSDATAAAPPSEAFVQTLEEEMQAAKSPEHLAAILEREGLLYDSEA